VTLSKYVRKEAGNEQSIWATLSAHDAAAQSFVHFSPSPHPPRMAHIFSAPYLSTSKMNTLHIVAALASLCSALAYPSFAVFPLAHSTIAPASPEEPLPRTLADLETLLGLRHRFLLSPTEALFFLPFSPRQYVPHRPHVVPPHLLSRAKDSSLCLSSEQCHLLLHVGPPPPDFVAAVSGIVDAHFVPLTDRVLLTTRAAALAVVVGALAPRRDVAFIDVLTTFKTSNVFETALLLGLPTPNPPYFDKYFAARESLPFAGEGQVIAFLDTGVDRNNCLFGAAPRQPSRFVSYAQPSKCDVCIFACPFAERFETATARIEAGQVRLLVNITDRRPFTATPPFATLNVTIGVDCSPPCDGVLFASPLPPSNVSAAIAAGSNFSRDPFFKNISFSAASAFARTSTLASVPSGTGIYFYSTSNATSVATFDVAVAAIAAPCGDEFDLSPGHGTAAVASAAGRARFDNVVIQVSVALFFFFFELIFILFYF
jgi:hypothetical protein